MTFGLSSTMVIEVSPELRPIIGCAPGVVFLAPNASGAGCGSVSATTAHLASYCDSSMAHIRSRSLAQAWALQLSFPVRIQQVALLLWSRADTWCVRHVRTPCGIGTVRAVPPGGGSMNRTAGARTGSN